MRRALFLFLLKKGGGGGGVPPSPKAVFRIENSVTGWALISMLMILMIKKVNFSRFLMMSKNRQKWSFFDHFRMRPKIVKNRDFFVFLMSQKFVRSLHHKHCYIDYIDLDVKNGCCFSKSQKIVKIDHFSDPSKSPGFWPLPRPQKADPILHQNRRFMMHFVFIIRYITSIADFVTQNFVSHFF